MARTEAPAAPVAAPDAQPPPAAEPARPVLDWPSEWPVPEPPQQRHRRGGRGLPMAPVLAASGNATAMAATAAYVAGGPLAVAATGVAVATGATSAVVKRRATVKRRRVAGGAGRSGARSGMADGRRGGRGAMPSMAGSGASRRRSGGAGGGSASRGGSTGSGPSRGGRKSGSGLGSGSGGAAPRRGGGRGSGLLGKLGSERKGKGKGRHAADTEGKLGKPGKGSKRDTDNTKPKGGGKGRKDRAPGAGKSGKGWGLKAAAGRMARAGAKKLSKNAIGHRDSLTGRAARAAWKASAPAREKARRTTARQAKRARGAAWDGLRALGSGAWMLLRGRGSRAALDRLRDVWARRRAKRKGKTTAPATPTVAATVRRPTITAAPPTTTGVPAMSGHHFTASAAEMCRAAANYSPTGMLQVGQDFAGLEEALRLNAEAMKITVENADAKFPLAPQIIETMRQIHALQLKAAELSRELQPAFHKLHDVDIARLENPRKGPQGERMWDVASNL